LAAARKRLLADRGRGLTASEAGAMDRPGRRLLLALLLLGAGLPAGAFGKQLYEYVDADGVRHFSDVAPDTDRPVRSTRVEVQPKGLVQLVTRELGDGQSVAEAINGVAGPVEVELSFSHNDNVQATPALPLRRVVPANGRIELARFGLVDRTRGGGYRVLITSVPGDPTPRPGAGAYRLPFASGTRYVVGQAFGGAFSHTDPQNFHAVDLGVAEGETVLAARAGVVMEVERDFHESGTDRARLAGRANLIRIVHDDGSMAVYAHLAFESALVRPGQAVRAGQALAQAGSTGFATGPHLHFAVQRNVGMRLESIPFEFQDPDGTRWQPVTSPAWRRAP
jgi:murein DD-endopeptidase MepM/ murein hydrolase activator NlpD